MSGDVLFYDGELFDYLKQVEMKCKRELEHIPQDQLFNTDEKTLIDYIISKHSIEPLKIYEDKKEMEQYETEVEVFDHYDRRSFRVKGIRIVISIPYTGNSELWKLKPNTWTSMLPRGVIQHTKCDGIGQLSLVIEKPDSTKPEDIKKDIDDQIKTMKSYINFQETDLKTFNRQLPDRIQQAISERKDRLGKHAQIVEVLKIPLKKRNGVPNVSIIPVTRKLVRPLPPVPNKPPEHGIREEDYEHILNVIRHEGKTYETTPATYAVHDEEELRDIILAHLNGHYEGDATGETFRKSGKTDIRIEFQNRAAFVGECKIWHGDKKLIEAMDQLLGYLTWKDCKTAIIVFNKDISGFSSIQRKIPAIIESHPNHVKKLENKYSGEWRYSFKSREDEERRVIVHVFLFNLFVEKKGI